MMDINELRRRAGITESATRKTLSENSLGGFSEDAAALIGRFVNEMQELGAHWDENSPNPNTSMQALPPKIVNQMDAAISDLMALEAQLKNFLQNRPRRDRPNR